MRFELSILLGFSLYYMDRVEAGWKLILSHKDVRNWSFNPKVKETYLENPWDETENTFTNIGDLDPDCYVDPHGNYHFKMMYTNLQPLDDNVAARVDNHDWVEIQWHQDSWLTESKVRGYFPVHVPAQNVPYNVRRFKGLRTSPDPRTLLDGSTDSWWYNSAGVIQPLWGALPAFNNQMAYRVDLYINDYYFRCCTNYDSAQSDDAGMIDDYGDDGDGVHHDLSSKYDLNMIMVVGLGLLLLANLVTICYFRGSYGRDKTVKYATVIDEESESEAGLTEEVQLK